MISKPRLLKLRLCQAITASVLVASPVLAQDDATVDKAEAAIGKLDDDGTIEKLRAAGSAVDTDSIDVDSVRKAASELGIEDITYGNGYCSWTCHQSGCRPRSSEQLGQ